MEGLEFIKDQLKRLNSKIRREEKDSTRWREVVTESDAKLKKLYAQRKDLEEMIAPYLLTENIDGKQDGKK